MHVFLEAQQCRRPQRSREPEHSRRTEEHMRSRKPAPPAACERCRCMRSSASRSTASVRKRSIRNAAMDHHSVRSVTVRLLTAVRSGLDWMSAVRPVDWDLRATSTPRPRRRTLVRGCPSPCAAVRATDATQQRCHTQAGDSASQSRRAALLYLANAQRQRKATTAERSAAL